MSVKNQPISAVQSTCVTAGWSDDGIGHAGMNQSLLCKVRVRTGHWLEEGIRLAHILTNQSGAKFVCYRGLVTRGNQTCTN